MNLTKYFRPDREELKKTEAYELYVRGERYKSQINLYEVVNQNYRYYEGNQWKGVQVGNLSALVFNIIRSIGRYKVATILMNDTKAIFSPMDAGTDSPQGQVADLLTRYMETVWENLKLDWQSRKGLKHAYITGDLIAYVYYDEAEGREVYEEIDNVNFYPGDVNSPDVQRQPWVIVVCRRPVTEVRDEAMRNGLSQEEAALIVSDTKSDRQAGDGARNEMDDGGAGGPGGMCNVYIKFWKDKQTGTVHCSKSTETVDFMPDTDLMLRRYPFAHMQWEEKKGEFHGQSDVEYMIQNQKALNLIQSMSMTSMRYFGYPKMVYNQAAFGQKPPSNAIGAALSVVSCDDVRKMVNYLTPPPMSGDTYKVFDEILSVTKDLNGANDAALGNVNPEQASGVAITATINQVSMPLDEQRMQYYNFVEDLALVFADMWATQNRELSVRYQDEDGNQAEAALTPEQLAQVQLKVKIDVGATNRWTEGLVTQSLNNMLEGGHIDFETFVELVPKSSGIPKEQLLQKIRRQKEEAAMMQQAAGTGTMQPGAAGPQRGSQQYIEELLAELTPGEQAAVSQQPEILESVMLGQ